MHAVALAAGQIADLLLLVAAATLAALLAVALLLWLRFAVLWIGTNNGISQMDADGLHPPEGAGDWARGLTVALHESRDGAMWIADIGCGGLIRIARDGTRGDFDLGIEAHAKLIDKKETR